MTRTATTNLPVIHPGTWIGAAHRAAVAWYPRVFAQGRALAENCRYRLQSIRFDRAPRIGRMSGIGLLLLATSGIMSFSTILPLVRNVAELEAEAASREASARSGRAANRSPSAQIDAFMKRLPTQAELPAIVTVIVTQATAAGLELESGRYEFAPSKSGQIGRYRLTYPVRGSYPQLRKFIDGTLAAVPVVALEGLRLERTSVGEELLDAELRFTVVVRSGT